MRNITVLLIACISFMGSLHAQDLGNGIEVKLTDEEIANFKEQAIKSVTDLSRYIKIIGEKNRELNTRKKAVNLAVGLFSSEENVMQVSSRSGDVQTYSVREYVNRLLDLKYSYVSIKWYNVYLAKNFKQGPDKKYYGLASITQKFEGRYNNEMGAYKDITTKTITITVELADVYEGADKKERWILKLGDIKVEETK